MNFNPSAHIRRGLLMAGLMTSSHLAADPQTGFAECVVENSGDRPVLVCGDERIDIRSQFDRSLDRINEREIQAIAHSGIFADYYRLLDPDDQLLVTNLAELGNMLGSRYPEWYGAFILDVTAAMATLRERSATQIEKLVAAYRRFDPGAGEPFIGPEPPKTLEDSIRDLAGDLFIGSGEPAEIMALDAPPNPIGVQPLRFSSAHGFYFFADTVDIDETSNFVLLAATFCIQSSETCVWPSGWDFLPPEFSVVWESSTLTQQEIADIVQQNGYEMTLEVNGIPLEIGPPTGGSGPGQTQGYYAVAMPPTPASDYDGPGCAADRQCLATGIFARDRLREMPLPWRVTLTLYRLNELDPPIIIIDPDSGSVQGYALERELIGSASRTIVANPTNGQSFFVEAISNTFKSARCMDCHGFGTADALAEHHDFYGGLTTEQFVLDTDLHLVESAYVPGAHVIACNSCHYVPTTDNNGHFFEETEWKAPYVDLQVDWRSMTRSAICRRVRQNLPNHSIRMQHFTEDARLFWAIEAPYVLGEKLEPPAYPGDFENFLNRIFWWSLYVNRCPE